MKSVIVLSLLHFPVSNESRSSFLISYRILSIQHERIVLTINQLHHDVLQTFRIQLAATIGCVDMALRNVPRVSYGYAHEQCILAVSRALDLGILAPRARFAVFHRQRGGGCGGGRRAPGVPQPHDTTSRHKAYHSVPRRAQARCRRCAVPRRIVSATCARGSGGVAAATVHSDHLRSLEISLPFKALT
jgi:hypothetical protein